MEKEFTSEEIQQLRELLTVAEIVKEEAEYRAAMKLVLKTWKNIVLGLAGFIAAGVLLREHLSKFWAWFVGG